MASELTRIPDTLEAPAGGPAADPPSGLVPDAGPPRSAPVTRAPRPGHLTVVVLSGLLTGAALLGALLTGWSGRGAADRLGPAIAGTALLVLLVAVTLVVVTARGRRARGPRTMHRIGSARPFEAEPRADVGAPNPAGVLTGQADVIAACDRALSSRDLVGGEVAMVVLDVIDVERLQQLVGPTGVEDVTRQILRRLRAWLPAQDRVARLGTSSFAVLLEGLGADGAAPQVARLTALLEEPMSRGGQVVEVRFAAGIAQSGRGSTGTEMLLRAARATAVDSSRRLATASAGPTEPSTERLSEPLSEPFTEPLTGPSVPSPTEPAPARDAAAPTPRPAQALFAEALDATGRLQAELVAALRESALQAAFRPIIRLDDDSGRMVAVQALPRWTRPDGQDAPPQQLEAVAARAGMSAELSRQLLERGLDAVAAWYAAGFAVGRLAVQLGQAELSDPDLPTSIATRLTRRQLPGSCLVVEVDAASVSDGSSVRPSLVRLREQGAEVILTGVVTPQAAFGLLTTLPLSGISLHRRLTAVLDDHPVPARATVTTCRRLGLRTIAENVTTEVELRAARACGIDAAWGPAIASPARARDLSARLNAARSLALRG